MGARLSHLIKSPFWRDLYISLFPMQTCARVRDDSSCMGGWIMSEIIVAVCKQYSSHLLNRK